MAPNLVTLASMSVCAISLKLHKNKIAFLNWTTAGYVNNKTWLRWTVYNDR